MFENITQRCVKIVQIRSYLWSIFSCICTEYGNLLRKSPNSIRIQENTDKIILSDSNLVRKRTLNNLAKLN